MTEQEKREVHDRCYVCGSMDNPSFWVGVDEESDYRIGFCDPCGDDWNCYDLHDLPMIPIPYMEMFDDERPFWLPEQG